MIIYGTPTLYIKPNATVELTSNYVLKRTVNKPISSYYFTSDNGLISVTDNNKIKATTSSYGVGSTLTFHCEGSETSIKVIISSLCGVGKCIVYQNRSSNEREELYYIRDIAVNRFGSTTIIAKPAKRFRNSDCCIDPDKFFAKDANGRRLSVRGDGARYYIDIPQNCPSPVTITYYEYEGEGWRNEHKEEWNLCGTDNTSYSTVQIVDDDPGEVTESNNIRPTNVNNIVQDINVDDTCEVIEEPIWSPPEYTWSRSDSTPVIHYDVDLQNCDNAYLTLVKRSNPSVPTNTALDYSSAYALGTNHISYDIQKAQCEDGLYDILIVGTNYTGTYTSIMDTIYLGPSYAVAQPHIYSIGKAEVNERTGAKTFTFRLENCQKIKYQIIKRSDNKVPYNESILNYYDSFSGREIVTGTALGDFKVTVDPINASDPAQKGQGAGVYDIVIYGMNSGGTTVLYNSTDMKGVTVNNPPLVNVYMGKATLSKKVIDIDISTCDKDEIAEAYYYVQKKDEKGAVEYPSAKIYEDIKNGKREGICGTIDKDEFSTVYKTMPTYDGVIVRKKSKILTLDASELGTGYYDVVVYAKDSMGTEKFNYVMNNVSLADENIEKMSYQIKGEPEGNKSSIAKRYVQYVDVRIPEISHIDKLNLKYYISKKDITNGGKNKIDDLYDYCKSKGELSKLKTLKNINAGSIVTIEVDSDEVQDGQVGDVYLYVQLNDNQNSLQQSLRTGSIHLDKTKLDLISIYANRKEDNPIYKLGDKIEISMAFSHDLDETAGPDLYIKVGDNVYKQDSVKNNGNVRTFIYNVLGDMGTGTLSLDHLDYKSKFTAVGGSKVYANAIYGVALNNIPAAKNFVGNKYSVDTVVPEITEMQINVTANEDQIVRDRENNIVYVKNVEDANLKFKYSENITGMPPEVKMLKGNKAGFMVYNGDTGERNEEIYDLTDYVNDSDLQKYEGDLTVYKVFEGSSDVIDKANNRLAYLQNYNNTTYTLNGLNLGNTKLVFDTSVYEPEIYLNGTKVNEDGSFYNGARFKLFAEYSDADKVSNYSDLSGINNISVTLYTNNTLFLEGNDEMPIPGNVSNSDDGEHFWKIVYNLTEDVLPVTLPLSTNGDYKVIATKEDNLGNISKKELKINIEDSISISRENSGLLNVAVDQMHKIKDMTDEQKKYTVALNLTNIDTENIKVYKVNDDKTEEELQLDSSVPAENLYNYCFKINRGGKYKIKVKDLDENEIFTDFVEVTNAYIIGDTDCDGRLSSMDVVYILKYIALFQEYRTDMIKYAGNVDGIDTIPDVGDAVILSRFLTEDRDIIKTPEGYYRVRE